MKKSFDAHESPLAKVFCDDYKFTIPKYQRPYSWSTEQASELIDDLLSHLDDQPANLEDSSPYFLGSIVLIKADNPESEVIDGQQRLTTLTIFFSVLRHLTNSDEMSKFIVQEGNSLLGIDDEFRLSIRPRDNDFFCYYVLEEGHIEELFELQKNLTDSQQNIQQNAIRIYQLLKCHEVNKLVRLSQFVLTMCYIVIVSTPDIDSAYRIFSVMNDRGLELTATDILKSTIIGEITETKQEEYTRLWEDLEESTGREAFNELFSHIRMIHRKAKLKGTLVREFRDVVKPEKAPENFIDSTLIPMGEAFLTIKAENYQAISNANEVNQYLQFLNRLDNFDWVPVALCFLSKKKNQPVKLLPLFRKLERLAATMMLMRATVNYRISRYADVITSFEAAKDLMSGNSAIDLTSDEKEYARQALRSDIYTITRIRLPLLLRLDSILSDGSAKYNYPIITVEHVLPQTPAEGSDWISWFPDEELRTQWVHKLANLVLLSRRKNSSASNYNFDRKKDAYFQNNGVTPFALTTQVINQEEWTPEILSNRQEQLIDILENEWDL